MNDGAREIVQAVNLILEWIEACQNHEPSVILTEGEDRTEATVVIYALAKWRDRLLAIHPELMR